MNAIFAPAPVSMPPLFVPDARPAADAAAIAQDKAPKLPLAVSTPELSSPSQVAAVARSNIASLRPGRSEPKSANATRLLKPYGIMMLPSSETLERLAALRIEHASYPDQGRTASDIGSSRLS